VVLPDDLVERAGAHPHGQRLAGIAPVIRGRLEQVHGADGNNGRVIDPPHDVRRLAGGVGALLELAPGDAFVTAEADPARVSSVWAGPGGSVGWVVPSRRVAGRGHLVALGDARGAAGLLLGVLAADGSDIGSVSMPRDADALLRPTYTLDPRNDWEWFATTASPPRQPGEEQVGWLDETDLDGVRELLAAWSPRHDVAPGEPGVLGWCGLRAEDGRLVAVAAHTQRRPGVPHLASIATDGEHRGRGLGAAVTAWLTRRLLDDGHGMVTLGMYSDNDVARRLYERLGYTCFHRFTSGRLVQTRAGPS
jgi:ribosomal protein S18 acetylase RimI-like enzyme